MAVSYVALQGNVERRELFLVFPPDVCRRSNVAADSGEGQEKYLRTALTGLQHDESRDLHLEVSKMEYWVVHLPQPSPAGLESLPAAVR